MAPFPFLTRSPKTMSESNWCRGVIRVDSGGIVANPGMSLDELRATPLGAAGDLEAYVAEYPKVLIGPVMISGIECDVDLEFERGVLAAAHIFATEKTARRFSFVTGYASPPDGPEVAFLEEWVRRETGATPPARFSWGQIADIYDRKGGIASISFIYR